MAISHSAVSAGTLCDLTSPGYALCGCSIARAAKDDNSDFICIGVIPSPYLAVDFLFTMCVLSSAV